MASNRPLSSLANASAANRSSTSLITPKLTALSDPPSSQVDARLLDLLTHEVIRLIIDAEKVSRTRRAAQEQLVKQSLAASSTKPAPTSPVVSTSLPPTVVANAAAAEQEEADNNVRTRLDTMGYKVGWALSERLARDRPRFPSTPAAPNAAPAPPTLDPLETIKFICKDLWISMYDKQVDNLRTNHRGVYVLHDNAYKPFARMSGLSKGGSLSGEDKEVARRVKLYLAFPAGIIRGALANLGIACTVTAESLGLPQSTFQIKTIKPGAV